MCEHVETAFIWSFVMMEACSPALCTTEVAFDARIGAPKGPAIGNGQWAIGNTYIYIYIYLYIYMCVYMCTHLYVYTYILRDIHAFI